MKNLLPLIIICFAFFLPANDLLAQTASTDQQMVELTQDELKGLIRKIAELRRQRVLMWQRQQIMMQRRAAVKDKPAGPSTIETRIVIREDGDGRIDTTVIVTEGPPPGSKLVRTAGDTSAYSPSAKSASVPVDNNADLADLRRRLDRQEQLLLDIRDRPLVAATPPPTRSDTIIQQIMLNQREDEGVSLSREDVAALTTEVSRMNIELSNLRRRLGDEEERRRRAEDEVRRARDRDDRTASWESERLLYERDLNRARREEERIRTAAPVMPVVIEEEAPVRIIRDTVYVDRVRTTPVFIPTAGRTDTVIVVKETIRAAEPTIVKDTVVVEREREVVRTDTLQLKSIEPISFPSIFFDNNSSQLNAAHRSIIAGAVNLLSDKPNYTVRLTGFASPSGNAAYNQQLSAKRAAAVRQGFENAGLDGNRVVIVPGGIDFKPANAAAARRVEVQALPK